jgi:glycosyltransferase involved in cell wall biosynthesis
MGNARTVVVSDIPENLEAVGDAGVTFPVGDAPALAATLSGLLETPERVRELGERAQERARTVYDWDRITRQTETLYLDVLRGRVQR